MITVTINTHESNDDVCSALQSALQEQFAVSLEINDVLLLCYVVEEADQDNDSPYRTFHLTASHE